MCVQVCETVNLIISQWGKTVERKFGACKNLPRRLLSPLTLADRFADSQVGVCTSGSPAALNTPPTDYESLTGAFKTMGNAKRSAGRGGRASVN